MTGRWTKTVMKSDHECHFPAIGAYGRGSVWECDCGKKYQLDENLTGGLYFSRIMKPPPGSSEGKR